MNISSVNSYYKQSVKDHSATSGKEKAESAKSAENIETKSTGQSKDSIEISANQTTVIKNTYNPTGKSASYDSSTIEKLKSDYETQVNDFKSMLRQMISDQSVLSGGVVTSGSNFSFEFKFETNSNFSLTSTTQVENSGAISGFENNDYLGAEQTANRIFDFATSLAGDDDKLLSTLKDSVLEGFKEVEKLFGGKGKLPSVCYETLDRVNELFDQRLNPETSEEK